MSTINPGKGFRLLKLGDVIEEGDEFLSQCEGDGWVRTADAGKVFGTNKTLTYRRRIIDGWIKTSERLPTREDGDADQQVLLARERSQYVSFWHDAKNFSLWRKLPPLPKQTEADAFEAELAGFSAADMRHTSLREDLRRFWNAGVEWQKKQTQNPKPQ